MRCGERHGPAGGGCEPGGGGPLANRGTGGVEERSRRGAAPARAPVPVPGPTQRVGGSRTDHPAAHPHYAPSLCSHLCGATRGGWVRSVAWAAFTTRGGCRRDLLCHPHPQRRVQRRGARYTSPAGHASTSGWFLRGSRGNPDERAGGWRGPVGGQYGRSIVLCGVRWWRGSATPLPGFERRGAAPFVELHLRGFARDSGGAQGVFGGARVRREQGTGVPGNAGAVLRGVHGNAGF
mmetsp:Transcript_34092/g.95986  ORF Transcript_34092/g.95986 Transcript_34092/m.95986 type:complete len:236 (-) Transcript_34092:1873-2580(-)